jgi:hypothetical protein
VIKKTLQMVFLSAALAGLLAAAEQSVSGYLMDKACSADAIKKGQNAAKEHGRDCALMDDCVKSGYGVVTADGQFIAFDAAGNQKAMTALKASTKENDLRVTVKGDVNGSNMKVSSLQLQ